MPNIEWLRALVTKLKSEPESSSVQSQPEEPEPTLNELIRRKTAAVYGGGLDRGDVGSLEPRDQEARFWAKLRKVKS